MKKILCMILALIFVLALIPAASADFEPAEGTPYGIPLFETVNDIDLAAVCAGHSTRRLLDLTGNIEVKYDLLQTMQGQTVKMLVDDFTFLDDGQYVNYSVQTDKTYNSTSYQLFLYDKDDPYYYVKHMGGRDKFEAQAEYIDSMLDYSFCPFDPDYWTIDIVSAEVVDGLYVYELDVKLKEDLQVENDMTMDNCTLKLDPETSLIRGYSYHRVISNYGEMTQTAEVNYGVDQKPDYSIKY